VTDDQLSPAGALTEGYYDMEITVGLDSGAGTTPGFLKVGGKSGITMSPQVTNITVSQEDAPRTNTDFSMRNFYVGSCENIGDEKDVPEGSCN